MFNCTKMRLSWPEAAARAVTSLSESLSHSGPSHLSRPCQAPGSHPCLLACLRTWQLSVLTPSLSARLRGCKCVHFCLPVCTRCSCLHGLYEVTPLALSQLLLPSLLTAFLRNFTAGFSHMDTGGPSCSTGHQQTQANLVFVDFCTVLIVRFHTW